MQNWFVVDLRERDGVVLRLEQAIRWFEEAGPLVPTGYILAGHSAGFDDRPLPASVVDLLDDLAGALAETSPREAGLSKLSWKAARSVADRATSSVRDDPPDVANTAAKQAVLRLHGIFSRQPEHPPALPDAREVTDLLDRANIERRRGTGGTLMTEPLVIACGEHLQDFELLDQDARRLGSAIHVDRAYELHDASGRCVLKAAFPSRLIGRTKWTYEVSTPDGSTTISVRRVGRQTDSASVTEGPHTIGMIRKARPQSRGSRGLRAIFAVERPRLLIEDRSGREVACVHIARIRTVGDRVYLVIERKQGIPEQLRSVSLAASVIVDRELISIGHGG